LQHVSLASNKVKLFCHRRKVDLITMQPVTGLYTHPGTQYYTGLFFPIERFTPC